jgi:hypothetical protein
VGGWRELKNIWRSRKWFLFLFLCGDEGDVPEKKEGLVLVFVKKATQKGVGEC